MKTNAFISTVAACAIALLLVADAQAQGKGSGGGQANQQRPPQSQQMQRQEKMRQPDSKHAMQQQRQLKSQLKDEDIYGHEMMTAEERERFREQLNAAGSDREWAQLRAEHQAAMRQRAEVQSRALEPPIYGQHMMTAEERQRYVERMQSARTDAERAEIREQHRETIEKRAKELGVAPGQPGR